MRVLLAMSIPLTRKQKKKNSLEENNVTLYKKKTNKKKRILCIRNKFTHSMKVEGY